MGEIGAREAAVADPRDDRRDPGLLGGLDHLGKSGGVELPGLRHLDAQVLHLLLAVVHLDRGGLERQGVGLAVERPGAAREVLDIVPGELVVERQK
jgi:hypothetical protein